MEIIAAWQMMNSLSILIFYCGNDENKKSEANDKFHSASLSSATFALFVPQFKFYKLFICIKQIQSSSKTKKRTKDGNFPRFAAGRVSELHATRFRRGLRFRLRRQFIVPVAALGRQIIAGRSSD